MDQLKPGSVGELRAIEEEIGRITVELSQLATFSRLNYTGFLKILKKHDKHTEYMLKPMFMLRLKSKPLYLQDLDNLIFRLSKLYDRLRSDDPSRVSPLPEGGSSGEGATAQVFVRKTSKYWVHSDNVTEVKCFVLKYLPVLIFPSRKRKVDLAVSSIYLDNEQMELYKGRLEKSEGAMAIRIRWYGSDEPQEVFIERKIHREDWTGEVSVKARFPIKEKHVNDFLTGTYTADDVVRKIAKDGQRGDKELDEIGRLAREIQEVVLEKRLRPMVRTFYNRTAFQLPGDARVRISLDTELTMIREDGPRRSGSNWRRLDIDTTDYPFSSLPESELTRFPHAILEVKLQTHAGQEPPKWAEALTQSHLVEEVPKFSKYIHGCATLFAKKVSLVPFWLPQMDVDIRKPAPADLEVDSEDELGGRGGSSEEVSSLGQERGPSPSAEAADGGLGDARPDHTVIPIHPGMVRGPREGGGGEEGEEEEEETPLLGKQQVKNATATGILGLFTKKNRVGPSGQQAGAGVGAVGVRAQEGLGAENRERRIFVPVRVEPKVFFANERTFLSWVHFSIFLGGIATALVGLGNRQARYSGFLFASVSVMFASYALYLYQWRASRIRERDPGPYDDRLGPVVVVIVFLAAMIANLIFTFGSE